MNIVATKARLTQGICCHFIKTAWEGTMVPRSCWKSRHKSSWGAACCWIRPGLAALLWLCVSHFTCGVGAVGLTKNVIQKDAEFDVTYNDTVTSENQTIYAFSHTVSRNRVSVQRQPSYVPSQCSESAQEFVLSVFLFLFPDGWCACDCGRVVTRF